MPVNYHTHTFRCGHAENVPDEAYLQRAVEQGFTVLGFSDHTPWQGLSPAVCRGVRMLPEELPGYFASIHALQEKYRGVIEIPLGLPHLHGLLAVRQGRARHDFCGRYVPRYRCAPKHG